MTHRDLWLLPTQPFHPQIRKMFRELEEWLSPRNGQPEPASGPNLNVWEHASRFEVEVDLPGVTANDLEILVDGRALVLKGTHKIAIEDGTKVRSRERLERAFERRVELPSSIDTEHVSAEFFNGVLRVTLPKLEAQTARRIQVAVNP
jgi:HSP20 family protein